MDTLKQTLLCFWLPVGRSVFGFNESEQEPLAVLEKHRLEKNYSFENTVIHRVQDILKENKKYKDIQISSEKGGLSDPYGRRYIVISVDDNFINLQGSTCIYLLSNGLCIVSFYLDRKNFYDKENNINEKCKEIADYVFKEILVDLFELNFQVGLITKTANNDLNYQERDIRYDEYKGILTYSQVDILQNYIFNPLLIPDVFFRNIRDTEEIFNKIEEGVSLESIFRSLTLLVTNNISPLFSSRKKYPSINILEGNLLEKENASFLLYLTSVAMEHFSRVAVNRGLSNYREGLDFCKKSLVKNNFSTKVHKNTGQIYQPSKRELEEIIDYPLLEAYNTLIYSKISGLRYLETLFYDNIDKIKNHLNNLIDDNYKSSTKKLINGGGIGQFKRNVEAISTDCLVIYNFVNSGLQSQTINELTDIRKIQEFIHEASVSDIKINPKDKALHDLNHSVRTYLSKEDWGKLTLVLTFLGAAFSFVQIVGGIPQKTMSQVLQNPLLLLNDRDAIVIKVQLIFLFIIFIFSLILIFNKQRKNYLPRNQIKTLNNQILTRKVYDFSSLRIETKANTSAAIDGFIEKELISRLQKNHYKRQLVVLRVNELNEQSRIGVLRKKYSIWMEINNINEKENNNKEIVLHIEIDFVSKQWFITDIRVVAKFYPFKEDSQKTVKYIIKNIIEVMVDSNHKITKDFYVKQFEHLNWDDEFN